ncbi:MAG: energy-coupled thiamine transporter ThiT [Acholeplasmatales bacterium]|nr:MAG: energy-coupled thiamine transporter ThiT [Acholeplasmatales bacterium]
MDQTQSIQKISEMAIFISFAFVIEVVFKVFPSMPQGGGISMAMLPLVLLTYRRGLLVGVASGMIFSMLNFILGGMVLYHWASLFLDYFIAFGVFGLSALIINRNKSSVVYFTLAIVFVGLLRFVSHYLSGVLLFAEWAPEGTPAWLYSLTYNAWYMVPTIILSALGGWLIFKRLNPLLTNDLLNQEIFKY